jgi:polyphosphate kinase 2 (PPK2 family)
MSPGRTLVSDTKQRGRDLLRGAQSRELAPWTLVPANDKRFARITVLDAVVKRVREALKDI